MDPTRFERLIAALGAPTSRRQILRILAGGASGLVALTGFDAAQAKKRKRKRRPEKPKTCRTGTPWGTVTVPASGVSVTTPALEQGQRYLLRAVGFWTTNAAYGNDAFAAFPLNNPNAPETTFQGVRLGLSVDGGSSDDWGSYNPDHIYQR